MSKYQTKLSFILLFFVLLHFCSHATNLTIELQASGRDQNQNAVLYLNEGYEFAVLISKGNRNTGDVEIAGLENFKIAGQGTSNSVAMVNGSFSSEITHSYELYPIQEGVFEIGPARILQEGKTIESNKIKVVVKQRPASVAQKSSSAKQPVAIKDKEADPTENNDPSVTADVFGKIVIDKKQAFVGEPVIAKIVLYARGPVEALMLNPPPSFPSFLSKEIKVEKKGLQTIKHKQYNVIEKEYLLIPVQQGEKEITPVHIIYTAQVRQHPNARSRRGFFADDIFDNFFQTASRIQQFQTKTDSAKIRINPLPQLSSSVDGVGTFNEVKAFVDKKEVLVNEPILLTLEIHGKGNLEQIAAPKLKLPKGFKFYESKSSVTENLDGGYHGGSKKFEFIVQVANVGEWQIPAQEFAYFDTEGKNIKTLHTDPIALKISPAEAQSQLPAQPVRPADNKTQVSGQDEGKDEVQEIRFIDEDAPIFQHKQVHLPVTIFIIVLLLTLLIYNRRFWENVLCLVRNKFFARTKNKNLDNFIKEFEQLQQKNDTKSMHKLFIRLISARYDLLEETVQDDVIENLLRENGLDHDKIIEFTDFLNLCSSRFFVADSERFQQNEKDLFKKANYWLLFFTNR